jgi:hypothetical protein
MATIFRAPLLCVQNKRYIAAADVVPNLLLTTLALVAAAAPPFHQTDWPTPVRARAIPIADVHQNVTLRRKKPPNRVLDWPTPTRTRLLAQVDGQQNVTLQLGLPPPPQIPAFDYPNPASHPWARFDDAPNLLTSTLASGAVAATLPPGHAWFELPPARARQPRVDDPPNVALNSPIVATLPFSQDDQPLPPMRARAPPYAEVGPNTTAAGIPPALLPFGLDDWPITVRVRWTVSPDLVGVTLRLPSGAGAPFNQDEWPTPTRARWVAPDVTPNLQGSTLRGIALTLPFAQRDWPNPVRTRRGDQNVIVSNSAIFMLPPVPPTTVIARIIVSPDADRSLEADADRLVIVYAARKSP